MSENYFTFSRKQQLTHRTLLNELHTLPLKNFFVKIIGDYGKARIKMAELFGESGWCKHFTGGTWMSTGGAAEYSPGGQLGKTIDVSEEATFSPAFNVSWINALFPCTESETVLQTIINDISEEDTNGTTSTEEESDQDGAEADLPASEDDKGTSQVATESEEELQTPLL